MTKTEYVAREGWARSCSLFSAIVVALTVMFSGCATASEADASVGGWVEPGWMAQFRQEMEEDAIAWVNCYAEFGVEAFIGPSFMVLFPSDYVNDPTLPARSELRAKADMECFERLGQMRWWAVEIDVDAYQRMLDSRDCVIAHWPDVPIPEPPSAEAWIEDHGQWNPHRQWFHAMGQDRSLPRVTQTVWNELNDICPQPGPFIHGMFGLDP